MTIQEIKQTAKAKLKGSYLKCCSSSLLFFTFVLILTCIQNFIISFTLPEIIKITISIIFAILSLIFSYGLIANVIDLTDGKTTSITDFINIAIKNTTKYLSLAVKILLKLLIPIILFILSIFYFMGSLVADLKSKNYLIFYKELLPLAVILLVVTFIILIYYILKYILSAYVYHENNNYSINEIIAKSKSLMKGQKGKYILLILSFINWFIITAILMLLISQFLPVEYTTPVAILLYTFIKPYMIISQLIFCEENGDIMENSKKEEV